MPNLWTGERVRLRAIEPEDWQSFQRFDADTAMMRHADRVHPPRSAAGYRRWTAEECQRPPQGDQFRLAIETVAEDVMVGTIITQDCRPDAGVFGYGVAVGAGHVRRGYASEAIVLLLAYMFGERRYQKCEIGVHHDNEASLALHAGLGFVREGRLRRHVFAAGRYLDLVLLGMTVEEFGARRPRPPGSIASPVLPASPASSGSPAVPGAPG